MPEENRLILKMLNDPPLTGKDDPYIQEAEAAQRKRQRSIRDQRANTTPADELLKRVKKAGALPDGSDDGSDQLELEL